MVKLDGKEVSCHSETLLTATSFQPPVNPYVPYDMSAWSAKSVCSRNGNRQSKRAGLSTQLLKILRRRGFVLDSRRPIEVHHRGHSRRIYGDGHCLVPSDWLG